jgi:hypothetical protein
MISELKLISGGLFRCLKRGYCVVVGGKELVLKKGVGTGLKNPRGGFGVKNDRDGSLAP